MDAAGRYSVDKYNNTSPLWANFTEQDNRFCLFGEDIRNCRTYLMIILVRLFALLPAKSAHLLSYNTLTLLTTNPLEESNMRWLILPMG